MSVCLSVCPYHDTHAERGYEACDKRYVSLELSFDSASRQILTHLQSDRAISEFNTDSLLS